MAAVRGIRRGRVRGRQRGVSRGLSWSRDATSNKGVPANAAEWTALLASAGVSTGNPSIVWGMQVASGNLTDSIGSFTGTAAGTGITYSSAVPGWTRVGITTTEAATGVFTNTDSGLPDLSTTSILVLSYCKINSAPGTFRNIHGAGTSPNLMGFVKSGPELQVFANASGSTLSGVDPTGQVRPFVLQHNITSSSQGWYTDQEKLNNIFSAVTGKSVQVCGGANGAADATNLYTAVFFGAAAEMSQSQIKAVLVALGWSPPWS